MMKAWAFRLLAFAALWLAALGGGAARADSWAMPEVTTTLSANGQFRFTVTPGDIEPPPPPRDAREDSQPVPRLASQGLLEKRIAKSKWQPVWAGPLANQVAPVTVLVADDGRHVATFDNWGSLGHRDHVIVIYGPDGTLVRSLSLTDLMPEDYIAALPRSVSSIYWSKDESFAGDGASVVIPVIVPHGGGLGDDVETVSFSIALADGAVTLPPPAQWERALAAAAEVTAAMAEAEAKWLADRKAPLTPPQGCEEQDWHEYLREAHARLSAEPPLEISTSTTVLFPRDHPRYRQSLKWLRDEVTQVLDFPTNAAFASPCDADGLVAAFARAVARVKPGSAVNSTFYIAAPEPQFAAIARLAAPTGARTVWIDLASAIPQRLERIPGTPEYEAAQDAEMDRISQELAQEMP
jgi:hypothetical protein